MFAVVILLRGWLESILLNNYFNSTYYSEWTVSRIINTFWSTASFVLFIALMKFTIDRFVLERQKKELENEKLNAELNYLKAQINPHFLFNTLHNLNYLSQIKSDQATEVIVKLSNIMRYMIYDSSKSRVPLFKEIGYIKDYLSLESIRLNNRFELVFDTHDVNDQLEIAPLIFIPFVENAFKHGVSDQKAENWIKVKLASSSNQLSFKIENSIWVGKEAKEEPSGFGLKNLRQRLALSYPNRHQLYVNSTQRHFSVSLILELS